MENIHCRFNIDELRRYGIMIISIDFILTYRFFSNAVFNLRFNLCQSRVEFM